jgi:preprotein translocase subunit YajC
MNVSLLLFQDAGSSGLYSTVIMVAAIFGIFYFLIIRPQKRQKDQLAEMVSQLKINDEVVTNGGIIGKIKEIKDSSFIVQSAEKSFLEIGKSAVVGKKPE